MSFDIQSEDVCKTPTFTKYVSIHAVEDKNAFTYNYQLHNIEYRHV